MGPYPLYFYFTKQEEGCLLHEVFVDNHESREFDYTYIFKDGPGEYLCEIIVYDESVDPPAKEQIYSFLVTLEQEAPTLGDSDVSMNETLLAWLEKKIGKKVGIMGHCEEILSVFVEQNFVEAVHIELDYGIPVQKNDLMAGDIIEMDQAVWREDITYGKMTTRNIGIYGHVVIIYEDLGSGKYRIAHQNLSGVPKVAITGFDVNHLEEGEFKFFRLYRGFVEE